MLTSHKTKPVKLCRIQSSALWLHRPFIEHDVHKSALRASGGPWPRLSCSDTSGTSVGSVLGPGLQPWGDTEADPSPV